MDERSEVILNATKEWRDDANEAFDKLPRGSQKKCAADIGCAEPTLSQLLSGQIDASPFVGRISEWLGIPKPEQITLDPDEHEILKLYRNASDEERKLLIDMIRRIVKH
jgi:hypothetical protein